MIKKIGLTYLIVFAGIQFSHAQQNFNAMNSFFKDRLYHSSNRLEAYSGTSFFPITEDEYNLTYKIADTSKQYNSFSHILFQKHLLEFKGENYHLTISPVFDFTLSKDLADTSNRRFFQNTRGFHIEGDLMKNFSFSTSFYENQSRNTNYQSTYYSSLGELYVNHADSTYVTQNAVIPGAARTKPFKVDGFDYAFAVGSLIYKPFKVLTLSAGNNTHFIGDGYRSVLLSDNGCPAPYFQANYRFLPKWEFVYMRSKLLNLTRKPASTSVEAYYQPKGFAVNYLSFKATPTLTFSLFEGTIYSRGDSVSSHPVNALYYNPIPVLSSFLVKTSEATSLLGLNIGFTPLQNWRLYGQFAYNLSSSGIAGQIGTRISEPFKVNNLFIQLEANYSSNNVYSATLARLNYSHYNLPMAHIKGQGFTEGVFRINYEWKRMYADLKTIFYLLENYSSRSLLPTSAIAPQVNASVFHNQLEVGYRFNRKMNFSIFASWLMREESTPLAPSTNFFSLGIKTGLLNQYTDF